MMDNNCDDISVEEMARRVEQMAKSADDVFKKETQYTNDKRDENDENGVVVELNEDQNDTHHLHVGRY